jgi:transcriptional regulator with XRE-family HTH domain
VASRRVGAVDIHVGRRVRAARLAHRISQEKLAEAVGVSFQQIQKYEKGVNRIGTGRLHAIAKLLQLPVTYFFDGVEKTSAKGGARDSMNAITEALSTAEGVRIALALSRIHDAEMRRRVAKLLEALIETEGRGIRTLSKV